MCGIAGFVSPSFSWNAETLLRVSETLAHRGPDDEGFFFLTQNQQPVHSFSGAFGKPPLLPESKLISEIAQPCSVGLLHRRLAIIAPEAEGHQPMSIPDQTLILDYNGEVYNYLTLRKELEELGCVFTTRTDTEVVLQAYKIWGESCLEKLDGMWSMAILDLEKNILFASTDRTGIKPFYYHSGPSGFCFASEIKAFRSFGVDFTPNPAPVSRFLAYGQSDETDETMYRNIFRLQGGQSLTVDLRTGSFTRKQWHQWTVNSSFDYQPGVSETERIDTIRELLLDMIRLRLQADVPLGVCLSGGIDSSTMAGLTAFADQRSHTTGIRKAFMATIEPGSPQDESGFARMMAAKAGFDFYTTQPDGSDLLSAFQDLIYTLDEPPPGLNAFSQYAVFQKVASEGVRVTLDGQGADEIFAGYPRHNQSLILETLSAKSFPAAIEEYGLETLWSWIRSKIPSEKAHSLLLSKKPEYGIFREELFALSGSKGGIFPSVNTALEDEYTRSSLPFLLKAADRNSMRWSIESRMPFADFHPLVEAVLAMPGSAKIQQGQTKYLLRKAAAPFVPSVILQRRDKVGFAAPNRDWLSVLLKSDFVRDLPPMPDFLDEKMFEVHRLRFLADPESVDPLVLWRGLGLKVWGKGIQKSMSFR